MKHLLTCIICPNGCEIEVESESDGIQSLKGAACPRGKDYAEQEAFSPMRTIASSVLIEGGKLPLVSVRLDRPIPKGRIFDVMAEIQKVRLWAPVYAGEVILPRVAGLDSSVIATKTVERQVESSCVARDELDAF